MNTPTWSRQKMSSFTERGHTAISPCARHQAIWFSSQAICTVYCFCRSRWRTTWKFLRGHTRRGKRAPVWIKMTDDRGRGGALKASLFAGTLSPRAFPATRQYSERCASGGGRSNEWLRKQSLFHLGKPKRSRAPTTRRRKWSLGSHRPETAQSKFLATNSRRSRSNSRHGHRHNPYLEPNRKAVQGAEKGTTSTEGQNLGPISKANGLASKVTANFCAAARINGVAITKSPSPQSSRMSSLGFTRRRPRY